MTNKSVQPLTLSLLLIAGAPLQATADDATGPEKAEEDVSTTTGTIEFGAGYVSDDAYRFGRFTGMHEQGLFAIGAFDVHFLPGRPDYMHLQGGDLGLDSRWLSLEYGKQGQFETLLEYRELPNFTIDTGMTPYQGVESDTLTLAPGASPDNLLPLSLDTKRERIKAGVGYFPKDRWKTRLTVSHENKDGADWIGGGLLASGPGNGQGTGVGRTYAVILPEPVDQTTTEIDAALAYNGEQGQWSLSLHGSLFNNANTRLRWDEPGFTTGSDGGGNGPGGGGNGPGGGGNGPGGGGNGPGGGGNGPGGGGNGPGGGGNGPGGGGNGPGGGGNGPGGGGAAALLSTLAVADSGPGSGAGGGLTLPAQGQLALAPDNQFFQIGLSGSTQLNDTTRFTGVLSAGLMQQDDDFLPYGIDGSDAATAALPRDSLDGEVYLYSARAILTSRPARPLRLKAQYRYDERDDQTDRATYQYDVMDSGAESRTAVTNEPRSYRKHKAGLDADYRFSSEWRGSLGYDYHQIERDYSDVEKSREHIGSARLNWRPRDDFDAMLRLGTSSREASEYQALQPNQNPLLRKYNVADRDRDSAGVLLNYAPIAEVNVGLSADMTDDDYTDSSIGLTEGNSKTYNLDITYHPTQTLGFAAFYTYDRIESRQIGDSGLSRYRVDFDDRIDTLGLSADMDDVWRGWDLGLTYTYSKGRGDIEHTGLDTASPGIPYPTLENELQRVELSAAVDLNKTARLKLAVIYEDLTAEDWALDGYSATPTNGLLTLGNESEDYDVFAFMVALQYRF